MKSDLHDVDCGDCGNAQSLTAVPCKMLGWLHQPSTEKHFLSLQFHILSLYLPSPFCKIGMASELDSNNDVCMINKNNTFSACLDYNLHVPNTNTTFT